MEVPNMLQWQVVLHVIENKPHYTLSLVESNGKSFQFVLSISLDKNSDGDLYAHRVNKDGVDEYFTFPASDLNGVILEIAQEGGIIVGYKKEIVEEDKTNE